jgi:hypothetical protein
MFTIVVVVTVDGTVVIARVMGYIIVKVSPGLYNAGIQGNNETIVKIEPSVNGWQSPPKHPFAILHVNELPVHDIVVALYIRKIVIAGKIWIAKIGGP